MRKRTIYEEATGRILRVLGSDDPWLLQMLSEELSDGEAIIEGEHDPATVYILNGTPTPLPPRPGDWAVWDGKTWIDPRTPDELAVDLNRRQEEVRTTRNHLLMESDWTQMPDADLSEEAKQNWRIYRQALRDITENVKTTTDLDNLVWPKKPR